MNVLDLLSQLRRAGILLSLDGDKLKIKAPPGALTDAIKEQLKQHKAELIEFLQDTGKQVVTDIEVRADRSKPLPLSFTQQGLWVIDQLNPGNLLFSIPMAYRLQGNLQVDLLEQAINAVARRHESLRTRFLANDLGEPFVVVDEAVDRPLPVSDVEVAGRSFDEIVRELLPISRNVPFDLGEGPLVRLTLHRLVQNAEPTGDWLLEGAIHHIVSDGWSMNLFVREIVIHYASLATGTQIPLPELPVQYVDYAQWQHQRAEGDSLRKEVDFWLKELAGTPDLLQLPTDRPRVVTGKRQGGRLSRQLDAGLSQRFETLCREAGLTQFMGYFAVWSLLMARHARQDDFCIGVPSANRPFRSLENLIGYFANFFALRSQMDLNLTARDFLQAVKQRVMGVSEHQDVPFHLIVEGLKVPRNPNYPPLVQVGFQFQDFSAVGGGSDAEKQLIEQIYQRTQVRFEPVNFESSDVMYDMLAFFAPGQSGLNVSIEFNRELYGDETVERLIRHCTRIIEAIVANPAVRLADIDLVTPDELHADLGIDAGTQVGVLPLLSSQLAVVQDVLAAQGDSRAHLVGAEYCFNRAVSPDVVERAVRLCVQQHAALRTRIRLSDVPWADFAYQLVDADANVAIDVLDLREQHVSADQVAEQVGDWCYGPFDLFGDHLVEFRLVWWAQDRLTLVCRAHGVIMDADSLSVIMNRIAGLADSIERDQVMPVFPDSFAAQIMQLRQQEDRPAALSYWRAQAQGAVPLEFSRSRALDASQDYQTEQLALSAQLVDRLQSWCAVNEAELGAVLRFAAAWLIKQYCRVEGDFVCADIAAQAGDAVGPFAQTLPLVMPVRLLAGDAHVSDAAVEMAALFAEAKNHAGVSPQQQAKLFESGRLRVQFRYQPDAGNETLLGTRAAGLLQITATQRGGSLVLNLACDGRAFASLRFLERMQSVLEQICDGVAVANALQIQLPDEKAQQQTWNSTHRALQHTSIVRWFEETVERFPGKTAVVCGDVHYSYDQLNRLSNRLAHKLHAEGVGRGSKVALVLGRSVDLWVALWGVIKSGAAYVPVEISYPQDRIDFIISDCGASHVIAQRATEALVSGFAGKVLLADQFAEQLSDFSDANLATVPTPDDLFYLIYTSGSTGKPKGAGVFHLGEANLQHWYLQDYAVGEHDSAYVISALGFDLTQKNLFGLLLCGGTVVLPSQEGYDAELFVQEIAAHRISIMNCAPSAFYPLVQQAQPGDYKALHTLRYVFLGGEPIRANALVPWLHSADCVARIINSYGPTECTDVVSAHELSDFTQNAVIPIGKPVCNTQLWVVNQDLQPLPVGLPGEICVTGTGVGYGYLNRDDLTAEVFVANPFGEGRLYKTGDLGRYLADGSIEYIGRKDFQVKIRGLRIELGEIETAMKALPAVVDALAMAVDDTLVGYLVTSEGNLPSGWRDVLRKSLPEYMVPAQMVALSQWPLTPNGKIDRKALPKPQFDLQLNYVAPRTDLEEKLAQLWADVLKLPQVGVRDDFFQLGGQSLLATQLVNRMSRQLNRSLSVRMLFENTTIEAFAQAIEQSAGQPSKPVIKRRLQRSPARLSYGQQRLWLFEQMNPGTAANNMSIALKVSGALNATALEKAVREIIRRQESLRTSFVAEGNDEPVQLIHEQVEWSLSQQDMNGLTADEFAVQLQQRVMRNRMQPMDLQQAPLLRVELITRRPLQEYYLLFCMHHIVSDGASVALFIRELIALYVSFSQGKPSSLPELRLHYADYAEWQRDWLTPERLEGQLTYWREKLAEVPPLLELPLDKPRPTTQTTEGASLSFSFDPAFVPRLRAFCAEQGVTPFMFTLTAWKLLLAKYSGQHDIVVGVPSLGRDTQELENIIGFFIHSFVLRTQLGDNPSVKNALQRVRQTVLDAFSHGDVPVDMLVEHLGIRRNPAYSPLVQVAFQLLDQASMQQDALPSGNFGDVAIEPVGESGGTAKFDITLNLSLAGDKLAGSLEYNTALFVETIMQRLIGHFCQLCETLLAALDTPVQAVALDSGDALLRSLQLDPQQIEQVLPLSAMQYDMFMDSQVNPESLQNSHGWHIHINRPLDVALWQRCIQIISDHQPMMRVRFVPGAEPWHDMGYLAVARNKTIDFSVIDLAENAHQNAALEQQVRTLIYRPYDLLNDELIRYGAIKLADDHYVVFTAVHHAVLDGAALNSLWEQLTALYTVLSGQGSAADFAHVPAVFDEFLSHDLRVMDTAPVLSFWRDQFRGVEPLDFTVPAPVPAPSHFITRERFLADDHFAQLKRFCREHRITPALYLKSLFALMIQSYCRPDSDFSLQETMGGRIKGHYQTFGCYIQEIPFIVRKDALAPHNRFSELLEYARQYQKTIKDQRLISIGKQLEISPKGRVGFMFNYYQFLADTEFLGERFNPEGTPSDPANNVQFVVTEVGGKLKLNLFYHGHLFADFGFLERIESLSQQIISGQATTLGELQFVTTDRERQQLLHDWNDTKVEFDLSQCIHQRFETQVQQHPERSAVADDHVEYSYAELNRRANQLAHYLRQHGIDRNHLVGLCAERSADFLVGILGIMKAGGAYVPMDPKYPQDRLDYMIENSQVAVLLTQHHLLAKVGTQGNALRLCLDTDWHQIAQQPEHNPDVAMTPRDRAYMIYTSGSTGLPKGAIIRHDGAVNHIEAERRVLGFNNEFSFLQTAPASSDISVWQFLGAITCGGKTVILDDVTHAKKLFELVQRHHINLVELVPVALQLLMEYVRSLPQDQRALPSLNYMMATGEAVSVDLVNDWLALYPQIPVVNAYGPTEAADDVIQATITQPLPAERKSVPIGQPLANLAVYILDDQQRLVPPGVPGEICIGGIGVGEGYWHNPEKTAAAFMRNPFSDNADDFIYRTGDLGRWLADGSVEYLDRVDNQVKVRGFRIELGEVEAALSAQPGVRECAVIVRHDMPGGTALAGYVTADEGVDLSSASLRTQLRERLPDFMVPTAITVMPKMPLTPAGKIDRKALPKPDTNERSVPYVAPRNDIEAILTSIWSEVLRVDQVGIHDNFFELGGHSLLATQVVARVRKNLGVQLPIRDLMTQPTVEALAQRVARSQHSEDEPALIAIDRTQRLPLSFAQQRLWLLDRIEPGSVAYNVPSAIRIHGPLDSEALQRALSAVFNRHEGLRAIFVEDEQGPYQQILAEQEWPLTTSDLRSTTNTESELLRRAAIELMTPFTLEQGPLFRAHLFRLNDNEHVFSVIIHHIVTDGWSMGLLIRELATAYLQITTQGDCWFQPLPLQYLDFAAWQRARLGETQLAQMLDYWKTTLDQVPALHLPTDKPRPPVQTYNGATHRFQLPAQTRAQLNQLAQRENASLFMTLLAAFAVTLQRYSGQDDFAIGTPVAGRDRAELENIVGFFVNTLAIRVNPSSERSFRDLLQQTRTHVLDGFSHQEIPFEQIVEAISPARDMSRSPLFQVMLAYQNLPIDQDGIGDVQGFGDIRIEPFNPGIDSAKFDLTLTLWDEANGLGAALQYNSDLFHADTIARITGHFAALAERLAQQPDLPLHQHQYLSADEREQQLVEWNLTRKDYDPGISVHQWFDQTAQKTPDAIAIRCGEQQLTYRELQQRSNQVAHYLIGHGVQPGDNVAIVLDRNLHLMTAILGVLKAGAAYVPLDASYPEERLRYILDNADIKVGITRPHLTGNLPQDKQWIRWDDEYPQIQKQSAATPEIAHDPERLLYIIFTSGSTGKPKGTGAWHRSEINLLHWYIGQFNLNPQDNVLLLSAVGFDLTQKNLFGALIAGATLVIPDFQEYDAAAINQCIEQDQISWINCAPSAFYPLQDEPWQWAALRSLRYLFLGGEPINLARLASWLRQSQCQLINSYGPTECTDIATWYAIELERDLKASALPIGRPNDNITLYVLGEQQELLPIGAIGELCIGGDGVGPGYLNNPAQTDAVFLPNPHKAGERIYRTGDRVRYRPDGIIEYYGRRDHQMKLRGYRIEAGEIQAVLNQSAQVKDSLVDVISGDHQQQKLIAWVVSSDLSEQQQQTLQQRCRSFLPSFMVPEQIILLDHFPLTPNGKVDRKALPKPQFEQQQYVAPRNELEQQLSQIWAKVLGLPQVGIRDDFFQLGGQSLLATQLVSRMARQLNRSLSVRMLFENPTIEALAERIGRSERSVDEPALVVADRTQRLPLSFAQQRLWLLDRIEPGSVAYNVPSAIRIHGPLDSDALQRALSAVFNRHEGLRAIFVEDEQGPYQQILAEQEWPLTISDLRGTTNTESELLRRAAIELMTPFTLEQGPLFRAHLFRLNDHEHVFSVIIHHIVTDGWSMGLLIRELATAYLQITTQGDCWFQPLPLQYLDFAAWQRARLGETQLAQMLDYWKTTLDQVPALHLPTDKPRPPVQTYNGATHRFQLPAQTRAQLNQLAQRENASLFMTLLAAFAVTLQRYSGQDDFAIGTPVAGRDRAELENIVGFFVNTLAIRVNPSSERSFRDLLQQTRTHVLDGFSHQEIPFEQIVEAISPARDMSRSPLFQVMLAYQNLPIDQDGIGDVQGFGDIRIEPFNPGIDSAKFDLTLTLWDEANGLGAALQYNSDLFHADTITRISGHFAALAERLAQQPDLPLHQHQYLSADEREQQLVEWNLTRKDYDPGISVHQWFDQTAQKTPDAIAIRCGEQQLTYRELQQRSNQVAHYLIGHGVQPGDNVAIVLDRNLHLMTAILGVLKAGAAYVPLDASYPEERLRYILDNADIKVGITRPHLTGNLPQDKQWIRWDDEYPQILKQNASSPEIAHDPERLLYIIFTSGSTGKPKGTGAWHRSEINLLHWYIGQFNLNPPDNVLLLSAVGFDLTQKNLFGALIAGATLVIPDFQEYDAAAINQCIEQDQISWINCAPSAFYPLQDEPWQWAALRSLRYLFLGGEPINLARLASWLRQSQCQLINSYGPTECTDIATWYAIELDRDLKASALPIGRPNDNVTLYVLGEQQELLPIGAIGELCIGGDGVGPGYLNNPAQTDAVFLPNPHKAGERIYRTGDRVRYRPDGIIEYYGRRDHQMKLRGYRIEAGEIQAVLNQSAQVKDSLVDVISGDHQQQKLIAWVVSSDLSEQQQQTLQQRCRSFLPSFMVPEQIILLDHFPLTPNGKVDRKALPKPQFEQQQYVAPRNELEQQLSQIWAKVLGLPQVGIRDDFFQLGGQSLLATQLVSRMARQLNRSLSVRMLFENPTIDALARAIESGAGQGSKPVIKPRQQFSPARLSFGQQRLWFFEEVNPGTAANNMPTALRIRGPVDGNVLERACQEMIRRHESLRTTFVTDEQGEPVQVIHKAVEWTLLQDDYSGMALEECEERLAIIDAQMRNDVFDLAQGPLFRAALIKTDQHPEFRFMFCMHHIVSDGASIMVFFRELLTLYLAYSQNLPSPLPELRLQYADFAQWQREWMTSDRLESQLSYWQQKLARAPALLELPLDYARPAVQSTEGATAAVSFSPGFAARLKQRCTENGVTPFMFMLAGWKLLLSRYSGQSDIVIGVPTLGRHAPELDNIIGFFINSLVLRTDLGSNPPVNELLQRIKQTVLEAFANDDVPVDMILERLGIRRNPAYSPLVQVAFQLLDGGAMDALNALQDAKLGDLEVEVLGSAGTTAKFDLTLSLTMNGEQLGGSLEYNATLFEPETIERLLQHYQTLCEQMVADVELPLSSLQLLDAPALLAQLDLDQDEFTHVWSLSAMQHDMFMDNLVNPMSLQSSHGWHIHIHRELDIDLWHTCLQQLSDEQPMLRTRFVTADKPWLDMGYLAVCKPFTIAFDVFDWRQQTVSEQQLEQQIRAYIYRPYNLQTDALIHYGVIRLKDDHVVVMTAVHHAVLDGAALNSLWEQLTARYTLLLQDQVVTEYLPDNFPDFVTYDRRVMDTAPVLSFWRDQFRGVEPLDFTVPAPVPAPSHFITRERFLADDHFAQLKRFCREQRITPALYLKSLFALMIQGYCRPDSDFSLQETMGGRIKGHYQTFGCYIQEIPFIVRKDALAPHNRFSELLEYARQYQKTIKDQRLISIGKQLEISPKGRVGFMFNYYQFLADTEFLGERFNPEGTPSDPANNVQFVVTEVGGKLKLNLFYHGHLFADFGFLERIESLSQQIISGQATTLGELQFVTSASERQQLLQHWNDTKVEFDLSQCIHQRFETQVQQHPERSAVADDHVEYSYAELNRRANQLAHYLRQHGIDRNHLVGLCAERSADFLVGILGIMKAGGAYVPMDPKYPQDRLDYMIENSQVAVLLTQHHLLAKVGTQGNALRLCLDTDWHQIAQQPEHNPDVAMTPRDRAYMIYTSGSTGLPKGAIIRHDGAVNHIEAERRVLGFSNDFSFLQTAPASSDISVWQFVGPITCGGKSVILDDVTHAKKLFELVQRHHINLVELVPVALQLLMEYVRSLPQDQRALPSLKFMMATGEAVSVDLVNDWLALYSQIPVVNAYGPTEAADDVIQATITQPLPATRKSVPIGQPLANLAVYILDDQQRLVPPGVPGEICIGGIGVGEGYWHNPEKTAAAFLRNPFSDNADDFIYRTGDLGRWLADGSVEYLDRVDNQVKVRGFRIELGEVEAALSAQPGVRECAVIVRHDMPGGTALAGYVTADEGIDLSSSTLRSQLRERLPDFMVPTAIMVMPKMPLTPAGKIDRKALPRPESVQLSGVEYTAPRTDLEALLADIWEGFLPVDRVGVHDNFFELGGHSLIGVRLVARINKELDTQLQVAALLAAQTVEKLAQLIEQGGAASQIMVALSESTKPPLFLIHPVGGDVLCYSDLAQALRPDFSVYGLRARGLGGEPPFPSFGDMVATYVNEIRSVQPVGPYRVGGQSLGGIIALAVARMLEQSGEQVEQVLLLDTFSPAYLRDAYGSDADIMSAALGRNLAGVAPETAAGSEDYVQRMYRAAAGAGILPADVPEAVFHAIFRVAVNNHRLASQTEVESIRAKVHHFTAQDNPATVPSGKTWQNVGLDLVTHTVPGGHETLMQGPNAAPLARLISSLCK